MVSTIIIHEKTELDVQVIGFACVTFIPLYVGNGQPTLSLLQGSGAGL
jgi:hypothetical protein